MHRDFVKIKREYDAFYNEYFLSKGKFPLRDTGIGYWGPSISDEVFELFKRLSLEKSESFLDLGSGDGKVVLIASLFTNATGIENDKWLFDVSNFFRDKLGHKATFIQNDYLKHPLSDYDILFCSPDKPFHRGVENKLRT